MNVSRKSRRRRFHFVNAKDFRAFERQAACHDKADVAAAQNYAAFRGHFAHKVDVVLRRARGEYARRTGALYENLPCRSFSATRCKDDGFCRNVACAVSVDKVNREAVFGFSIFVTNVRSLTSTSVSKSLSMNLSEYSGPESFSLKVISPKPSCMHCFRIPPSFGSRSISNTFAPSLFAEIAAARPAGPPPITTVS